MKNNIRSLFLFGAIGSAISTPALADRVTGFDYYPAGRAHARLWKTETIQPGSAELGVVTE